MQPASDKELGQQRRANRTPFHIGGIDAPATGALHMSLDVIVVGERGPASKGDTVDLSYFVAVTGPDRSILSKTPLAVRIVFDTPQKRAGVTDHIEKTIALGGRKGTDLTVDLGFQQSPEVVDFYKHFRGR